MTVSNDDAHCNRIQEAQTLILRGILAAGPTLTWAGHLQSTTTLLISPGSQVPVLISVCHKHVHSSNGRHQVWHRCWRSSSVGSVRGLVFTLFGYFPSGSIWGAKFECCE